MMAGISTRLRLLDGDGVAIIYVEYNKNKLILQLLMTYGQLTNAVIFISRIWQLLQLLMIDIPF